MSTLVLILVVATTLRFWQLGKSSLWFDEVVTMRVATAGGPSSLLDALGHLDGTRAPLHPLLLSAWIKPVGTSEAGARSLSAACGVITILLIHRLGRSAYNAKTGLWAAWLAAVSPPLVYYSRELRMYSWLVLVTCVSWLLFFGFRRSARWFHCGCYAAVLIALIYTHPVGLFMVAAHGLSYLLVRKRLTLATGRWLIVQGAVLLAILPWIGQYMNRGTDYPLPRYGLSFLLAVPIEYIGGNKWALAACVLIIGHGLLRRGIKGQAWFSMPDPVASVSLLVWAVTPPVLMYSYSYAAQPIFGPPRYHLFIAPAYLILLARGLDRLPATIRWPAGVAALYLSILLLDHGVYPQPVNADWKSVSAWLNARQTPTDNPLSLERATVVVHPSDSRFPREELEAARYYLAAHYLVLAPHERSATPSKGPIYDAVCGSAREQQPLPGPTAASFLGVALKQRPD